jgi:hypothetical protein
VQGHKVEIKSSDVVFDGGICIEVSNYYARETADIGRNCGKVVNITVDRLKVTGPSSVPFS